MEKNKIYELLNNFKSKTEAYNYFNITPNNNGIIKLKDIANTVEFDLNVYAERRKPHIKFCLCCGKELIKHQKKYCSHSCSSKLTTKGRVVSNDTKEKIRKTLTKEKIKICTICGQEICKNSEICKHDKKWFKNLHCFGFDLDTIGTMSINKEYYRIKDLILKEYFDNNLSPYDMSIKYNYDKNYENILHILKSFGVKTRNLSESNVNACLNGKFSNAISNNNKYQFKHGWHITWENKKIYYRSSYELEYCLDLDEKKIPYEFEYFRIKYWDSVKCKYRVAIPDVYIINDNKIIEIKSKITFNKQNIIDKFKEYIKMGFIVGLLLEKKEYTFDEILDINQNEYLIESFK